MGYLRIPLLILLLSPTLCISTPNTNNQQQQRPTRTLGSLFGSSSKPSPPAPTQPVQKQPQPTRPLVYQVKYYEQRPNQLDIPDARNYGTIDKSLFIDQQQQPLLVGQPPRVLYYNPLIPPPPQQQQPDPTYYTLATIGNTQVLVPCSNPPTDQLVYESNVALNVDHPITHQKHIVPAIRAPPPQQQTQQVQPQAPLVREQVVAAAAELSTYGTLPGSGVVGAGINSVPYGYYYYYYIPPVPQQQQQQSNVNPHQPVVQPDPIIRLQPTLQQQQLVQTLPQQQQQQLLQTLPQQQYVYNPYRLYPQSHHHQIPVIISPHLSPYHLPHNHHHHHQVVVPQASTVKEQTRAVAQQQRVTQQPSATPVKMEGQHK